MKVLFICLTALQVPFLLIYTAYYERNIGDIEWIQYEHYLNIFYVGIAFVLGIIGSRISLRWFMSIGLLSILSQIVLVSLLIDADYNHLFKPFPNGIMYITFTATLYFLIQSIVRFIKRDV
ncbi:hypothetical protein SAMN05421734_103318 [Pelagirhabdus alkalitolerans]|uniref:Uncharacterized protein n=1 Tax=Pelagirhabdus alkalitolerans TaxID=1612202 RepID=A0A1G6I198_9BACI|nr:hypothetical protein [Pelagirhabdus alkalitolerans]SDC00231.1 hypothetical protein SAMN05421734_103318 [Pelagirhabdus alkalitolerans]